MYPTYVLDSWSSYVSFPSTQNIYNVQIVQRAIESCWNVITTMSQENVIVLLTMCCAVIYIGQNADADCKLLHDGLAYILLSKHIRHIVYGTRTHYV
jgi:hypothetical protein